MEDKAENQLHQTSCSEKKNKQKKEKQDDATEQEEIHLDNKKAQCRDVD